MSFEQTHYSSATVSSYSESYEEENSVSLKLLSQNLAKFSWPTIELSVHENGCILRTSNSKISGLSKAILYVRRG